MVCQSIIVPCWNQLEFTRQCIAALKGHTRPPWELIVIDNGSTDGTADYLAGVRDMAAVPVTVVSNATNLGFPAAINQGLQVARGEYLVLLNNDVVVTDGWLDQLIALANAKPGCEEKAFACDDSEDDVARERRASRVCSDVETVDAIPGPALPRDHRPGRADVQLCRAAAVGRGRAVSRSGGDAPRLPGGGAMSTGGSGLPCPSCRGSAC